MYRPVNRSKNSGGSGDPNPMATKLAMTVSVKAMDSQRWICRIHVFQFNETSSEDEPKLIRRFALHYYQLATLC
jgi:hypothetical protein